jgi:hypothetical protein
MMVLCAVEAAAQLPVRTRQLQLISDNNTNYTRVESADGQLTNWTLTLPVSEGADYSLLYSDVTATDASLTWLAPSATAGYVLASGGVGAPPAWTDLSGVFWSLTGNALTNPLTNYIGTSDAQPLVVRTTGVERLRVNATGEVGIGTTATAGYLLHVTGVQGTPNVRMGSLSGAAPTAAIPVGFDRFVVANTNGDLAEVRYDAVINQTAWVLAGNATTSAWNGAAGSFLGTTTAQPLSIATTNVVPQDINFYTGVSGASNRMTIEGDGDIFLRGTAGTPNVTLTSVSGAANAVLPVGYDRVLIADATGLVSQASYSAVVNTTAWTLTGNLGTTAWNGVAGNYIGTNDAQDWVWVTNGIFRGRLVGGAANTGNLVLGVRTDAVAPFNSTAAQATDRMTILGGNLSLNSENSGAITREIIFRGTAGTGNFRIGSDGGDIFWQGGGGQMLQMGSFWGIQISGNRGVVGAPAFIGGAAANPSMDVIGTRTAAPILTTTPPAGLTANQQEWRNAASAPLSIVDADGDFGIGVTAGLVAKLQINAATSTGNALQIDPWGAVAGNTGELRQLELAANGANYIAWKAADNMLASNTYTWPNAYPVADDYVFVSTAAGITSWVDPLTLIDAWNLVGNSNALATSFIGPTGAGIPMNIATANAAPGDINFYIGTVAAANLRMQLTNATFTVGSLATPVATTLNGTLTQTGTALIATLAGSNVAMLNAAAPGQLLVNGTPGTPNVTLVSVSGAVNATIPVSVPPYDRVLIANSNGLVSQTSYAAVINTSAWALTGNAGTTPWNGLTGNFLGTTDAQPLVIATASTEAIRVLTTGNVGIGTSTPGQLLEVEDGSILIGTSATGTPGRLIMEESGANGNNFTAFQAAANMPLDATYTLPVGVGAANQYLRIAAAPAPTATTATLEWAPIAIVPTVETFLVNVDNYAVAQAAATTFIRLDSDGPAATRTFTLANGTNDGQIITIRCIAAGANGVQIDDAGNANTSGAFNMNGGDTITLIWDAGTWYETARRNN